MKRNPFYLKEMPVDAPFCDREKELADLISYATSNSNVVLFSPRRYGKTSLTKRVTVHRVSKTASLRHSMPLVAVAVMVGRNGWMPTFSGIPYPGVLNC